MKTLKFKSTIKCGACVAAVKPHLDQNKDIEKWDVDLVSPDRILTVSGENINEASVEESIKKAGYSISKL